MGLCQGSPPGSVMRSFGAFFTVSLKELSNQQSGSPGFQTLVNTLSWYGSGIWGGKPGWNDAVNATLSLWSLSGRTSYRKISWSLDAVWLVVRLFPIALKFDRHLGSSAVSICNMTFNRKVSQSLDATRFVVRVVWSFWNFKAMRSFNYPIMHSETLRDYFTSFERPFIYPFNTLSTNKALRKVLSISKMSPKGAD